MPLPSSLPPPFLSVSPFPLIFFLALFFSLFGRVFLSAFPLFLPLSSSMFPSFHFLLCSFSSHYFFASLLSYSFLSFHFYYFHCFPSVIFSLISVSHQFLSASFSFSIFLFLSLFSLFCTFLNYFALIFFLALSLSFHLDICLAFSQLHVFIVVSFHHYTFLTFN